VEKEKEAKVGRGSLELEKGKDQAMQEDGRPQLETPVVAAVPTTPLKESKIR
jgi:hypothetical protein